MSGMDFAYSVSTKAIGRSRQMWVICEFNVLKWPNLDDLLIWAKLAITVWLSYKFYLKWLDYENHPCA